MEKRIHAIIIHDEYGKQDFSLCPNARELYIHYANPRTGRFEPVGMNTLLDWMSDHGWNLQCIGPYSKNHVQYVFYKIEVEVRR